MPSAYPTSAELQAALEAEGLGIPANLDNILERAIARMEMWTGFSPLLGAAVESDVTFDPPRRGSRYLELVGGMWSVSAVTVQLAPWAITTQYVLRLPDAIEFISLPDETPQSVVVTGKRGRAETLPADLWGAILDLAKAIALAPGMAGPIASPQRMKLGDAEIDGGGGADATTAKATVYAASALEVATLYARKTY